MYAHILYILMISFVMYLFIYIVVFCITFKYDCVQHACLFNVIKHCTILFVSLAASLLKYILRIKPTSVR